MTETKLRRNSDLQMEWDGDGVLWVSSREAGVRLSLPAQAVMLLDAFDGSRSASDVVAQLGAGPELLGFIDMLQERNILVGETFTSRYFENYHVGDHHSMLRDEPRMETYQQALGELVGPETVVADCGTGTGVLALFAAKAGAKRVYAIEGSRWIEVAKAMAHANGVEDRIVFVRGQMEKVELPEKVDLIVSECMDSLFVDARMLPDVLKFRDKWLKPGGIIVPQWGKILVAPVEAPSEYADWMSRWETMSDRYQLTFEPLATLAAHGSHRRPLAPGCMLAPPLQVAAIDLATAVARTPSFRASVAFDVNREGWFHGFAGFFEAPLSPRVTLSTSPEERMTHWQQHYFPLPARALRKGDRLELDIQVGPCQGNRRRLDAILRGTHIRGTQPLGEFEQEFLEF